jgi:hypothetical protein
MHRDLNLQIKHVKRNSNSAVQGMAKEAIKYAINNVWLEEILNYIYGIVIREKIASWLIC